MRAGALGGLFAVLLTGCTASPADDSELNPPVTTVRTPGIVADLRPVEPLVDRAAHTASLLPNGRVLVVGGCVVDGCSDATERTELYDPSTESFRAGPKLAQPRDGHTATALPSGDLLIVGGYTGEGSGPLATAELYLVATAKFVPAGEMAVGRGAHAAALLADGRVLVVGGWVGPGTFTETVEVWDPETRAFSPVNSLPTALGGATATSLPDGRVLVVGGEEPQGQGLGRSNIYDPDRDSWEAGPSLGQPRFKHAAVALDSGEVLVVGGTPDDHQLIAAVEVFDGASFRAAGTLTQGRYKLADAVVRLPDGRVLVAGGGDSAEVYDPAAETAVTITATEGLRSSFATATVLGSGDVLVIGGYDRTIDLRRAAYVLELAST